MRRCRQAIGSVLLRQKMGFSVTSKQALTGNYLKLVYPHLGYVFFAIVATGIGLHREGFNPSVITNVAWASFNCIMFLPFIQSSFHWNETASELPEKSVNHSEKVASREAQFSVN